MRTREVGTLTLTGLVLSNLRGLRRKYAAFLFSGVLSILVFYLLASFVLHPDVVNGHVAQAQTVRRGLMVSQCIIVAFTVFFVLYSSWAFVKSRKKEFGLLCLFGATKSQVRWLIVVEHVVVGAIGVGVGLGLGIPLSKLMLDSMSRLLGVWSPVRFMMVVPAVKLTAALFMALFLLAGALAAMQVSPRKVVRLLREHQRPRDIPSCSVPLVVLSLLCIGGGYGAAWVVDGSTLGAAMLPVTSVVSLGTFLFFAQVSVAILGALRRRPAFLYTGLNLLTVGDLSFRMKENAWVLATVAVLSAAVITSMGTIYTARAMILMSVEEYAPEAQAGVYQEMKQTVALTAMIALLMTGLFFIAAGSMLYFRLFGEAEEDREKYRAMRKLGVSSQEIARVVTAQVLVFFFAPIVVGSIHCAFAMKSLSNVLRADWPFLGVYRYALGAIAGFSLVQAVYFLAARRAYLKEVVEASAG